MDNKIDITKYPEGFDAVIKSLDFLPGTYEEKAAMMTKLAFLLINS